MSLWRDFPLPPMRHEAWHGDRVVRCFWPRPAGLWAMFAASVARAPAAEAVVCGAQRMTYAALDDAVARLAAGLAGRGIGRSDRVVLFLDNRPEFVVVLLALQRLAAIAVPVGVREQRPGLAHVARQCGAAAIVAEAALADRLPDAADAPALRLRIVVGEAPGGALRASPCVPPDATPGTTPDPAPPVAPPAAPAAAPHVALASLLASTDPAPAPAIAGEHEVAAILYTSGTTGRPKGAMLTQANIVHSVLHYTACMRLGAGERAALAVPASHVTGLVAVIATMLHVGGCVVVVPAFRAASFVALLAAERITHTMMVPAMYQLCLLQPTFADAPLDHWRIGGYGGAPMPVATIDALAARLPALALVNAYGATETASPATMMPIGCTRDHADTVGAVLPAADIRVVDDDGREVPAGATGELWIAGPMVVPGYWDDAPATAASFTAGHWHSGDLGSIDVDGYVRVFDRKKDMLNRGGYKVYSVEVETVLMAWPGMVEAAVVGRPCPVLGERVHAVVYAPGQPADDAGLRAFCAARLADYKVPETVAWRDEPLPRNANGKLMKRLLREAPAVPPP